MMKKVDNLFLARVVVIINNYLWESLYPRNYLFTNFKLTTYFLETNNAVAKIYLWGLLTPHN